MDPFKPYQPRAKGPVPTRLTAEGAEAVALRAVAFIAADEDLLSRFLAVTGSDVDGLRQRIAERHFLSGVLDFLLADEGALLAFCRQNDIAPETPMQARERLSAPR